jgi:hypothetical protein
MILKFYDDIFKENQHKFKEFNIPNLWFTYKVHLWFTYKGHL